MPEHEMYAEQTEQSSGEGEFERSENAPSLARSPVGPPTTDDLDSDTAWEANWPANSTSQPEDEDDEDDEFPDSFPGVKDVPFPNPKT